MFSALVVTISVIAKTLILPTVSLALLWYCLWTTRDYRLRRRFSEATHHLTEKELITARRNNAIVLKTYYRSVAAWHFRETNFAKLKRRLYLRRAKPALIMMTVIDEHLAAARKSAPGPRYLRSRRRIIAEMKREIND